MMSIFPDNQPLISAVITTYRRPVRIVKRAAKSAAGQTYRNLEIIVVNDAPEDAALAQAVGEMLTSLHDERIRYLIHEHNAGACAARNTGILASKGEYIALLDDDDEWLPRKLERQLAGFGDSDLESTFRISGPPGDLRSFSNTSAGHQSEDAFRGPSEGHPPEETHAGRRVGMVYSPFCNVTKDLPGEVTVYGGQSGNLLKDLLRNNDIGGTSIPLIRREVFDTCGLFDERLQSSQDYDMWLRIAERYDIQYVDEVLSRRYVQSECITSDISKQVQGVYAFSDKHAALYRENPGALNYRLNRKVNKWLEQGHFREAGKLWLSALRARPLSHYNITEPVKGLVRHLASH